MRVTRSSSDASLLVRNLESGKQLPTKQDVTLLIGIDNGNDKTALTNALAAKYIRRNVLTNDSLIVPRLVADDVTGNYFYDMPFIGADNTIVNDAARVFFYFKICKYLKNFKLIFTLNNQIIKNENVDEFKNRLSKALMFLDNDIGRLQHSIALIITEVDPTTDDDQVKKEFSLFLEKIKPAVQTNSFDNYNKLSKFIEFVGERNEKGDLEYVAVSKKINKPEELTIIRKQMFENTVLIPKGDRDFEFMNYKTLFTQQYVELFKEFSKLYSDAIESICERIAKDSISHYRRKIKNSHNYYQLLQELTELSKNLFENLNEMYAVFEYSDFPKHFLKIISYVYPDMSYKRIARVLELTLPLEIYSDWYRRQVLGIDAGKWISKLNEFENMINENKNWFKFLYDFENVLQKYDVQQDLPVYVSRNCPAPLEYSFGFLCNKVKEQFGMDFSYTANVPVTEKKTEQLHSILTELIRNVNPSIAYNDGILTARGKLVRLSKIPLQNYGDTKVLAIYGSKKIYIDIDIKHPGLFMIVIAPKWEVVGDSREINLDGRAAPHRTGKAESGKTPGDNGKDGEPGKPGEPGGNFYGFAMEVTGGEKLKISVKGGNGGNGQDGGDGSKGRDGGKISIPQQPNTCFVKSLTTEEGDVYKRYFCDNCMFLNRCFVGEGSSPSRGGNGGNGGPGGAGAPAGMAQMHVVDDSQSKITFIRANGLNGKPGKGGKGGEGGKGKEIKCVQCEYQSVFVTKAFTLLSLVEVKSELGSPAESGEPGKTIDEPYQEDTSVTNVQKINIAYHIEKFKEYIRDGMEDNYIQRGQLLHFQTKLDSDSLVQRYYSAKEYIQAVQNLEKQFDFLKKDKELVVQLYSLSIQSILRYAEIVHKKYEDFKPSASDPCPYPATALCDEIKALTYLYSMLSTKIHCIKNDIYSNLVVDIKAYIDIVIQEVKELEHSLKQNIINQSTQNYTMAIDTQIGEAETILKDGLMPDIDSVYKSITTQMDRLIKEVFSMEQNTQKKKKDLAKKREQLEQQMKLNIVFGCLKGVSTILGFLGPVGGFAGSLIGAGTEVAENFQIKSEDGDFGPLTEDLPDHISKTLDGMDKLYDEKVKGKAEMWNEELTKIINMVKPVANDKWVEKLEKLKMELNDAVNKGDMDQIALCEKEIKDTLKEHNIDQLSSKVSGRMRAKLNSAIDHFEKVQNVYEHATGIYQQFKNDASKIQEIEKAIKKCEKDVGKLKDYKDQINNALIPMMGKMRNDLKRTIRDLSGNSKPKLTFEQYKIQRKLKDIRLLIAEFVISGPADIQTKLKLCVDKMIEIMDATINIYNQIESYKERKQTADLIALVNTHDVTYAGIKDKTLKAGIEYLDLQIQTNVVNQLKLETMHQFKMKIFPHIKMYIPPDQATGVLDPVKIDLHDMKKKIAEYESKIVEHDTHTHCSTYRFGTSTQPFFVWRNGEYKEQIQKLLSSRPTTFLADVKQTPYYENCVKFQRIHFALIPHNKNMRKRLNKLLDHFQIRMHHSGSNRYKCNDKYYLIHSESQTIIYNYEKRDGEHIRTNQVYKKMMKGDLMLSPYTLWTFELRNVTTQKDYTDLLKFKDAIDVALVGEGCFIDHESNICNDLNLYIEDVKLISDEEKLFMKQVYKSSEKVELNEFIEWNRTRRSVENMSSMRDLVDWTTGKLKWLVSNTVESVQSSYNWISDVPMSINNKLLTTNSQRSNAHNGLAHAFSYDVNGSLLLTNYLIRKLTGEKFVHSGENETAIFQENQAKAMKITNILENIIEKILNDTNKAHVNKFDPIRLQKEILFLLNTERRQDIGVLVETMAKEIFVGEDLEKFKNALHEITISEEI